MVDIARIAYEAYCESVGWKSFNGDPLPTWEHQLERNPQIAQAWEAAADAVANALSL